MENNLDIEELKCKYNWFFCKLVEIIIIICYSILRIKVGI